MSVVITAMSKYELTPSYEGCFFDSTMSRTRKFGASRLEL
jgi:hypothetical protein